MFPEFIFEFIELNPILSTRILQGFIVFSILGILIGYWKGKK